MQGQSSAVKEMKFAKLLYRLTVPGGIIVVLAFLLVRFGIIIDTESRRMHLYALIILAVALILSAVFHRSRLFLASLVLTLSYAGLVWLSPRVSPEAQRMLLSGIAFLAPLNLLAFSWLRDRGIISPAGERRMIFIGLQVLIVVALLLPRLARFAGILDHQLVTRRFSDWSRLPQPALAAFVLACLVIMISLVRRYRAVESSLLWALVSMFVALRAGATSYQGAVYFSSAGLVLTVAVLETSYRMAYHDELTRLPSRRALNEALLKLGDSYSIAMLDVDHFKKFNDTYGHESGDEALRMVASRLAHVAGGGKAYRYGGEEFAVLFPGKPVEEAFTYLDRMRRFIEQSTFVVRGPDRRRGKRKKKSAQGKTETSVTVSVGISSNPGNGATVEQVLRAADQALYKAKAKGRNCSVIAKPPNPAKSTNLKMKILQVG